MYRANFEADCRRHARSEHLTEGHGVRANVLGAFGGGWPMWVDSRDESLAKHLIRGGYWESWITIAMAERIQPEWNCVDVGANFGYYTLLMAHLAAQGKTMAIEASPLMCDLLEATIRENELNNCKVVQRAAWNRSGDALFLTVPQNVYMGGATVMDVPRTESIPCQSATLDDLLIDWPRVDMIKVDAEGAEPEIWEGMQQTLRRNPIVVLEFSPSRYQDARAFAQRIEDDGYPLATIDGASRIVPSSVEALATMKEDLTMLWLERRA